MLRNEKEQTTVLYTFSADGITYDPFVVYPGVRLNKDVKKNIPDGIKYTLTPSGWMTSVAFCTYLKQFALQAREKSVPFPIALFLDGHKSHEGLDVARTAREENVILIRLYPNATSYYQPADKGCFKPIKTLYEKFVTFNRAFNNFVPSKQNFAVILQRIHREIDPNWVIKSFQVCGLYPFNKNAIDYSRFKSNVQQPNEFLSDDSGISSDSFVTVDCSLMSTHDVVLQRIDANIVTTPDINHSNADPVPSLVNTVPCDIHIVPCEKDPIYSDENPMYSPISVNLNTQDSLETDSGEQQLERVQLNDVVEIEEDIVDPVVPAQGFNRVRDFLQIESPFHSFCVNVGPEKVKKFEDPNYLTEIENEKLLFNTYHQLKDYEAKRTAPLKLPPHSKPVRKGRIPKTKLHFVTTSKEYEQQVQQTIDLKNQKENEKAERKSLRELNKKIKEEKLSATKKKNNKKSNKEN